MFLLKKGFNLSVIDSKIIEAVQENPYKNREEMLLKRGLWRMAIFYRILMNLNGNDKGFDVYFIDLNPGGR